MSRQTELVSVSQSNGAGIAKSWVHFDGIGTAAIQDSFGVSSLTDISTGTFETNFTNYFINGSYAVSGTCAVSARFLTPPDHSYILPASCRTNNYDFTGGLNDHNGISAAFHGDLA